MTGVWLGYYTYDYAYDAQNRRIFSWNANVDTKENPTGYLVNYYTPSGQKLGAYTFTTWVGYSYVLSDALTTSDQYFGGRRLAIMDQLGSSTPANSGYSYFPWGEQKGTSCPQDTWGFGTYWHDSITGLDYAQNRYYSNAYGRFMTPDPYIASGGPSDPQSWNRYAYTRGDPVNRFDPLGTCDETNVPGDDIQLFMSPTPTTSAGCDDSGGGPCVGTGLGFESDSPTCPVTYQPVFFQTKKPVQACPNGMGMAGTFYVCLHNYGSDWRNLVGDLKSLRKALAKDPNCDDLLTSAGTSMDAINNVLNNPAMYYTLAAAIQTSDNTLLEGTTFDLIGGPAMVLRAGLFQSGASQFNEDLTILHELAHYTGVFGPENVAGNPSSATNDQTITKDCSKTLLGN